MKRAQDAGLKSAKSAQRFVSTLAAVYNTFNVQRHMISRPTHRRFRAEAMEVWNAATAATVSPAWSLGRCGK
jgi:putative transposase